MSVRTDLGSVWQHLLTVSRPHVDVSKLETLLATAPFSGNRARRPGRSDSNPEITLVHRAALSIFLFTNQLRSRRSEGEKNDGFELLWKDHRRRSCLNDGCCWKATLCAEFLLNFFLFLSVNSCSQRLIRGRLGSCKTTSESKKDQTDWW